MIQKNLRAPWSILKFCRAMSELSNVSSAAASNIVPGNPPVGTCSSSGCDGSHKGYDPISESELIAVEMATLKVGYWTLSEDKKILISRFTCRNFKAAVSFINAAAEVAERCDIQHHPDLHLTQYRNVEVNVFTHAVGGLTKFDFNLARELDKIEVDYSPKWLKDSGLRSIR